jgi:hypothetical protein
MHGTHVMRVASALFGRMVAERQRRRTRRMLENLPENIRKDIGWSADRTMAPTYVRD